MEDASISVCVCFVLRAKVVTVKLGETDLKQLFHNDGSWQALQDEWAKQCHDFDEDFSSYMPSTIPMLAEQIDVCSSDKWSGVFAKLNAQGEHQAICFANAAFIPKFSGRVLRIRNLILSPRFDFGSFSEEDYALLLTDIFQDILALSDSELKCPHVKFHFRSPADLALFQRFAAEMSKFGQFSEIKMVGSWLFVSKLLTDDG